jgi:mucin-2
MSDINIFGHKVSKGAAVAIGGGSLVVIYFVWKQHEASAASASTTSADAIDPVTDLPYSQDSTIDPLTGMAYLPEAQEYGSVQAAESAVAGESSTDLSSAYDTGTGSIGTSTGADLVPANEVQGTTYASNAAWAQAVEAGLTDIGYSSTDISAALGRYLGNLSETAAQASIVDAGIAEYGPPPVGSFQVIMASTTTTAAAGTTSTGTTATGSTTTTTGSGGSTAAAKPPATGPDPVTVSTTKSDLTVKWPAVGGATQYQVDVIGPDNGQKASPTVSATSASFSVATSGDSGSVKVRAGNAAGWGPWSATKTFKI